LTQRSARSASHWIRSASPCSVPRWWRPAGRRATKPRENPVRARNSACPSFAAAQGSPARPHLRWSTSTRMSISAGRSSRSSCNSARCVPW